MAMASDLLDGRPNAKNLKDLPRLVTSCRACPLWRNTTQGVAGEGPTGAQLILVGEQPGDQEDRAGKPFVGPAGAILDKALRQAKLPREQTYVTNAVKHFKHELRGKRRLHKRPDPGEIEACKWWLSEELRILKPKVAVALGATAARALIGRTVTISRVRGTSLAAGQIEVVVTAHPSFILRVPDDISKQREFDRLVADLKFAAGRLMALGNQ